MRRILLTLGIAAVVAFCGLTATAQEGAMAEGEMPEMGPPPEMQEIAHLVGTWDVAMESKMDPADTTWIPAEGVITYRYAAGGAAMVSEYESPMGEMQFNGISVQCYDRATQQWQVTWTDNMSARITLLTGERKDGKTVLSGPDRWGEMEFWSRVTTYNETETSFDWMYEMSMDGENWVATGRAKYTKR